MSKSENHERLAPRRNCARFTPHDLIILRRYLETPDGWVITDMPGTEQERVWRIKLLGTENR